MRGSRWWRLPAGVALALLLLALVLRGLDLSALAASFRQADRVLLLGSVATTLLLYAVRAWRWGYLLAPLGRVAFGRLFSATVLGFMTGLLVPRAGEVVRPYLVGRAQGMRFSAVFASIVLERIFDLVSVLALFALYIWALPTPAAQTHGPLMDSVKVAGGLTALAVLAILGLLLAFHLNAERALTALERLLRLLPAWLARPLAERLREFSAGLAVLQAPLGQLVAILAQSLTLWTVIAAGVWLNNQAFGIRLPFHSAFLILVFLVVGVAVPTPGLVGGFHAAYVIAMTQAFAAERTTAAAAGIMNHALTQGPVLVMGLLILMAGGGQGLTLARVAEMAEDTEKSEAANRKDQRQDDVGVRRIALAGRPR